MDNREILREVILPLFGFAAVIMVLYLVAGLVSGSR